MIFSVLKAIKKTAKKKKTKEKKNKMPFVSEVTRTLESTPRSPEMLDLYFRAIELNSSKMAHITKKAVNAWEEQIEHRCGMHAVNVILKMYDKTLETIESADQTAEEVKSDLHKLIYDDEEAMVEQLSDETGNYSVIVVQKMLEKHGFKVEEMNIEQSSDISFGWYVLYGQSGNGVCHFACMLVQGFSYVNRPTLKFGLLFDSLNVKKEPVVILGDLEMNVVRNNYRYQNGKSTWLFVDTPCIV